MNLNKIKNLEKALMVDPITCDPLYDEFKLSNKKVDEMTEDEAATE